MPKVVKFVASPNGLSQEEWKSQVNLHLKKCCRTTISAWRAAAAGIQPKIDVKHAFGLYDDEFVVALKWMIDNRKILPMQLEDCKDDGKKLTLLIVTEENPNKVRFRTVAELLD